MMKDAVKSSCLYEETDRIESQKYTVSLMACLRLPGSADSSSASKNFNLSGRLAGRAPLMPRAVTLAFDQTTWHSNEPGGTSGFAHNALYLLTLCLALSTEINIDNNKYISN